jgi:hypothetical protein
MIERVVRNNDPLNPALAAETGNRVRLARTPSGFYTPRSALESDTFSQNVKGSQWIDPYNYQKT